LEVTHAIPGFIRPRQAEEAACAVRDDQVAGGALPFLNVLLGDLGDLGDLGEEGLPKLRLRRFSCGWARSR
jgi:hypothetical protein